MREVMILLLSAGMLLATSAGAEPSGAEPSGSDGLELTLLAMDRAQHAAVLLEPSGGLKMIRVGDRLEGSTWSAELIRVGDEEARFDATVIRADGRVRRVDWFVAAKRPGESTSRSRILDPNPEVSPESTGSPKHLVISDGSKTDQRTFKLSKDGVWTVRDSSDTQLMGSTGDPPSLDTKENGGSDS